MTDPEQTVDLEDQVARLTDRIDELGDLADELEEVNYAIRDVRDRVSHLENEAGVDHHQRRLRELAKETSNAVGVNRAQLLPPEEGEPPTISVRGTIDLSDIRLISRDWELFEFDGVDDGPDIHLKLIQPATDHDR